MFKEDDKILVLLIWFFIEEEKYSKWVYLWGKNISIKWECGYIIWG